MILESLRKSIEGSAAVPYWTNEMVFLQRILPERLIVLGGGPIGLEIARPLRVEKGLHPMTSAYIYLDIFFLCRYVKLSSLTGQTNFEETDDF